MRWLWWLALPLLAAQHAELGQIQSVYLFPMGSGLDQHLAGHLTKLGLFQVVADPKKADAVFTDRLGEAFEQKLNELYPLASPAEPEKASAAPSSGRAREESAPRISSWGRGRGTIFLVNTRTRAVIWSVYERPRDSSPDQVDRAAARIAERLKRDLKGK